MTDELNVTQLRTMLNVLISEKRIDLSAADWLAINQWLSNLELVEKSVADFIEGFDPSLDPHSRATMRQAVGAAGMLAGVLGGDPGAPVAARPFNALAEALDELDRGNKPPVLQHNKLARGGRNRHPEAQARRRIRVTAPAATERLRGLGWRIGRAREEVAKWLNDAGMPKSSSGTHNNREITAFDVENWGRPTAKHNDLADWKKEITESFELCKDVAAVKRVLDAIVKATGNPKP